MSISAQPSVQRMRKMMPDAVPSVPLLETGDHLDQPTFHARYAAMPEDVKAELIGGVVYMPAASLRRSHGRYRSLLLHWLYSYEDKTPGVETYDNTTTIMGEESEPQPDACLVIHPDKGGQMRFTEDDYLEGAAEWVGEVASSTESYDLHNNNRDYEMAGVKEYVVVALRQRRVFWFVNRNGTFEEKQPDESGIICSEVLPGLWLDTTAFLNADSKQLLRVLSDGLSTTEHASFVRQLERPGTGTLNKAASRWWFRPSWLTLSRSGCDERFDNKDLRSPQG